MRAGDSVLLFDVGAQFFSVPLDCVREILPAVELLPSPKTFVGMEGLLDLRGEIIPVVDLSQFLSVHSRPPRYTDHLIVLHLNKEQVAIRVDRATELATFSEDSSNSTVSNKFVRWNGNIITTLDPDDLERVVARWSNSKMAEV